MVAVAMHSESKRCPIEPSWSCDIVDECSPAVVSESSESQILVGSVRCPHARFRTESEVAKLVKKGVSLSKCSIKGCSRPAVAAGVDGHDLCRFHVELARGVSRSAKAERKRR